jgi:hypothetical protein
LARSSNPLLSPLSDGRRTSIEAAIFRPGWASSHVSSRPVFGLAVERRSGILKRRSTPGSSPVPTAPRTSRRPRAFLPPATDPQQQWDIPPEAPRVLPCPCPRRSQDHLRSLRIRLRAEVAADPKQDRHVMSQTSSERHRFPVPWRWLHPDGDLSRPDPPRSIHPAPVETLQPPTEMPFSLSRPPLRAGIQVASPQCCRTCGLGANIKSP